MQGFELGALRQRDEGVFQGKSRAVIAYLEGNEGFLALGNKSG